MAAPISCCYRGCRTTVWAPAPTGNGLAVQCSSATCMQCRRVSLCLPHFRTVFDDQQDHACPNCKGRRWFVRIMGDARISAALKVAVQASGGRVEADPPAKAVSSPAPSGWRWLRRDQLPPDARVLDRGVLARAHPRGAALIVDGRPFEWICPQMPVSATRASPTTPDLVVAHGDGARLSWVGPDGARLSIHAPDGGAIDRPRFIDGRRFVYISRDGAGHESLWEGSIEPPGRIRQRRVTALGHGPRRPLAPVPVRRLEAVVALCADGDAWAPTWIRLSDGQRTPLAAYGPAPRALAGARRHQQAAWIDHGGVVRCAGERQPTQTLGRADGDLLAMTDDGRQVAWTVSADGGTEMTVCDVQTRATERHAIPGALVWIGADGG